MSISNGFALPDPTVLVIDDHDLVATALALSLRSAGFQARPHIVRSRDGLLVAAATTPGVALLDLDLGRDPDGTPIDGAMFIGGLCRLGWRVLALSGTSNEARIGEALAAGALAGISKAASLPVLVTAIRRAAQGLEIMQPERRRQLIEAYRLRRDRGRMLAQRLDKLSERERAVLERLAQGQRAQAIAEEFVVSVATVRTQIRSILGKLEVGSQLQAVTALFDAERANSPSTRRDNVV